MKKHCITFAPFLKEINGHSKDYHLSLNKAFHSKNWQSATFVQELCEIDALPENWFKNLYNPAKWSHRSIFSRNWPFLFNPRALFYTKKTFKKALLNYISKFPEDEFVLFFETFNTFHLYVLLKLLRFLPKNQVSLAFIYRYDQKQLFFKGKKDKKLLKQLENRLGKKHLHLFADTDLLVKNLSHFFEREVKLLPIPHTQGVRSLSKSIKSKKRDLTFWWAGPPRSPKGLSTLQKLWGSKTLQSKKIRLKLSEKTPGLPKKNSASIIKIPHFLSRKAYLKHLHDSDVVLMPYSKWNYECSSSGIFVEAICAGIAPAVSEGLWISKELEKHDLKELVFDFKDPWVLLKIEKQVRDERVQEKLRAMSQAYSDYHNEKSFANVLFQTF